MEGKLFEKNFFREQLRSIKKDVCQKEEKNACITKMNM